MTRAPHHIVIAGAGLVAQRATQALRRRGHDGPIAIVGDEARVPYDRPPLSKEYLSGSMESPALDLRPEAWYADHGVELILGDPAAGLDGEAHRLLLKSGATLGYDRLLIATGARPRTLPGLDGYENVHVLRSAADSDRLRDALRPGARLAIVGAGFIGQEVAATARASGVHVTMIEAAPTPLFGQLGPELGAWFAELHREEGVDVRTATAVAGFRGTGATLEACTLADGSEVELDALLVAVGVMPATDWLNGATAGPDVLAAGDAAGGNHWEAAVAEAGAAAHAMLGLDPPRAPRPSFWSDQYGTRIQMAGTAREADGFAIEGEPAARDFTALFHRDGIVTGGLLVGRPRALPQLRKQLDNPIPTPGRLRAAGVDRRSA